MQIIKLFDVTFGNGWEASLIFLPKSCLWEIRTEAYHMMWEHDDEIIQTRDPWFMASVLLRIMMLPKRF